MARTRIEIQRDINAKKQEIRNCEQERSKYQTALKYANKLVEQLNESYKKLTTANDYMKKYFTINKKIADGGEISKAQERINSQLKKVKQTIIPEINKEIIKRDSTLRNLRTQLNRYENELRLSVIMI